MDLVAQEEADARRHRKDEADEGDQKKATLKAEEDKSVFCFFNMFFHQSLKLDVYIYI